ncbi:hypothetical protein [Candidatus Nitronereus thalassa]|uniref:Uncharacterized protein n=1 Tax=Candidatus Nitronereus thalassa TaxID=3020898 RepID=A0ABU3K387_9BACT|nr:hypothetical protein [Candidatus Nitronereus thalassa]MDT7040857.1 hypothetical protein [Candidatus Nitronereus thalassa]
MTPSDLDAWIKLGGLVANIGIGGMVFLIWYFGQRRLVTTESLIEQYRGLALQHLEIFKSMEARHNAQYQDMVKNNLEAFRAIDAKNADLFREQWNMLRQMNKDSQETMLLNVQIQARLVEKLERMERGNV